MTEFGELPAPPRKKSGEVESAQEQERTSIFRWLRDRGLLIYMTAALSVATPFKHERLEAADIPRRATWMEGIQTLRKGVLYDQVETQGTFYIDNQTHRGKWIFGKGGTPMRVEVKTTDVADAVEAEFSAAPTQSITVCGLHNHPLSDGESADIISTIISAEERQNIRKGKHSVSFPPSGTDIGLQNILEWEAALKKRREKGVTADARQGVVDAAGITYHRPIKEQDLQQEFPDYFAELEQRKATFRKWKEAIEPLMANLVANLDAATLDQLHRHTKYSGIYDRGKYATFSEDGKRTLKRLDLKNALREGDGGEEIARVLFAGNPKAQKLQEDYITLIIDKAARERDAFVEARLDWIKTSMTVSPEQLTSTKEYTKLREAYARNAAYIRFVPHQKIPDEPPCAGTDYKP